MMPSRPNREAAVANLIASLQQQWPTRGFKIHPSLKFVQTEGTYGIDVQTTTPISKDEILVVIPESSRFSISNVPDGKLRRLLTSIEMKSERSLASFIDQFEYNIDGTEIALAVLVMYVRTASVRNQSLMFGSSVTSGSGGNNSDNTWCEQAATWPSEKEMMLDSPIYWTEKDRSILGKSFPREHMESNQQQLRIAFDDAVWPILTSDELQSPLELANFILPSVKDGNGNATSAASADRDELWASFLYGYSIVYSRCHDGKDGSPELIPIVELLNGLSSVCCDDINVNFVSGMWPFIRGRMFANECNLNCSALYAEQDIAEGSSLIISYGELTLSSFLVKYGAVPPQHLKHHNMTDSVNLWIPPGMVPDPEIDKLRCTALEKAGYPLDDLRQGKVRLVFLPGDDDSSGNNPLAWFVNGQELGVLGSLRQFLILSYIADEASVQFNIMTGRLRCNYNSAEHCHLLVKLIDFNIEMLMPPSSSYQATTSIADVEYSKGAQISSSEAAAILGRVCQRETLAKWRHAFCRRYKCPSHVDRKQMALVEIPDELDSGGCRICGRTFPCRSCVRCKWRGKEAATYCSRAHQKAGWKKHKHACRVEGN